MPRQTPRTHLRATGYRAPRAMCRPGPFLQLTVKAEWVTCEACLRFLRFREAREERREESVS